MSTFLIDFDGTIVEHKFPEIGAPLPFAFAVLKGLKEAGHELILWTCREDPEYPFKGRHFLKEAVEFCRSNGVEFDAVNEALSDDFRGNGLKRKPHANYHIDDHNFPGGFHGWKMVGRHFGIDWVNYENN
jgi:hypothetical protein